tara:strand:+ start:1338 stop:1727 length:390 start_codon:yes stop_codon:yes gene_type:complete
LVVKNFNRSFCLLDICHFDKPIALGFMGISVVDDFNASYCTDTLEELFEFIFSCLIGQVPKIESVGINRAGSRSSPGGACRFCNPRAGFRRLSGLSLALLRGVSVATFARRSDRFLVEADLLEKLLPPG